MSEETKSRIYRMLNDALNAIPSTEEQLADAGRADRIDSLADYIEKAIDALEHC